MTQLLINLEIVTPHKAHIVKVEWFEVESPNGSFVVGPGHESLISMVKPNSRFAYKTAQGDFIVMEALGGVFMINDDQAIALLDEEEKR